MKEQTEAGSPTQREKIEVPKVPPLPACVRGALDNAYGRQKCIVESCEEGAALVASPRGEFDVWLCRTHIVMVDWSLEEGGLVLRKHSTLHCPRNLREALTL